MTPETRAWQAAAVANSLGLEPRAVLRFAGLPVTGNPTWEEVVRRIAGGLQSEKVAA